MTIMMRSKIATVMKMTTDIMNIGIGELVIIGMAILTVGIIIIMITLPVIVTKNKNVLFFMVFSFNKVSKMKFNYVTHFL